MTFRYTLAYTLFFMAVIHLLFVRDAQAYLDPGALGFFFQMVAASILGALIALRIYWRKVKSTVKNLFSSSKEEEDA